MLVLLGACGSNTPTLPGTYLGSFLFTGELVPAFGDGGAPTTCQVDGGALFLPTSVQFYAQVSLLPDSGVVWQLQNGPAVDGVALANGFTVTTHTEAMVSGCDCTAALVETAVLNAPADAGLAPGLSSLEGYLDDRLDPGFDGGCTAAVHAECALGCDLIYAINGVPKRP